MPSSAPVADEGIAEFLRRDVLLYSALWSTSFTTTHFDPWAIMLNNTAIRAKLATFAGFQADIVMKLDINGTPSHYGRLLVAYEPFLPKTGGFALGTAIDIGPCVQLPHCELDPTTSDTQYMRLPYINNSDWIDLTTALGAQLGVVWIRELNALEMMSAATPTDVRVRIFGHFENVRLFGATEATMPTFTAQGKSEYSTAGLVSKPLTAVSNLAGALVNVPFIGGMARATQIGAGVGSKLAEFFGYSKPTNLETTQRMRATVLEPYAPLIGYDYSAKLSADPKKELAISSDAVGLASAPDDLAYSTLTKRWGYVGSYAWDTTATPTTTIFQMGLSPTYSPASVVFVTDLSNQITPLCLASMCNTFWSGSLEIRIDIVASAFHKGRLRMVYDPQGAPAAPTVTNVLVSDVVDISVTRSVCYTIPWNQACAWARTGPSGGWEQTDLTFSTHSDGYTNGAIRLFPDNELSSTLSTQGAYVNVYIRGGDDIQFAHPTTYPMGLLTPQSGGEPLCVTLGTSSYPSNTKRLEYMGEDNQSLRSLMKRPSRWRQVGITSTYLVAGLRSMTLPQIPTLMNDLTSLTLTDFDNSGTPVAYEWVRNVPTAFFATCFLGYRGNQRWKLIFDNPDQIGHVDGWFNMMNRTGVADGYFKNSQDDTAVGGSFAAFNTTSGIAAELLYTSGDRRLENGYARFFPALGDSAEIEVPDYNTVRFHVGTRPYVTYPRMDSPAAGAFAFKTNTTIAGGVILGKATLMHSAGEDFTFFFFKYVRCMKPFSTGMDASTTRYTPS
jgi:hypothetical protein